MLVYALVGEALCACHFVCALVWGIMCLSLVVGALCNCLCIGGGRIMCLSLFYLRISGGRGGVTLCACQYFVSGGSIIMSLSLFCLSIGEGHYVPVKLS